MLFLTTASTACALTAGLVCWRERIGVLDMPNERSSHRAPTPRTGGLALMGACLLGASLAWRDLPRTWLVGGTGFFTLGLLDDLYRLPERLRLALQAVLSLAVAWHGPRIEELALPGLLPWALNETIAVIVTAFWYTGFVNLFNFMDGTDGMAAGEALVAGSAIGILTGSPLALIASGAAAGFLVFNYAPARIFMGDGGSYLLGALLAFSVVEGASLPGRPIPFIVFVLILATFIVDTSVTLLRRIVRREAWFTAHRSHYYQKLTDLGASHAQVSWINVSLTLSLSICAVVYLRGETSIRVMLLAAWGMVFALGLTMIDRRMRR